MNPTVKETDEGTKMHLPHHSVVRLSRRREVRKKMPEYASTPYDETSEKAKKATVAANFAEKPEAKHTFHAAAREAHLKAAEDAPSATLHRIHTDHAAEHHKVSVAFSVDEIKKRKKLEDAAKVDAKEAARLRMEENEHGTNMRIKEASAQARLAGAHAKKLEAEAAALKAAPKKKANATSGSQTEPKDLGS